MTHIAKDPERPLDLADCEMAYLVNPNGVVLRHQGDAILYLSGASLGINETTSVERAIAGAGPIFETMLAFHRLGFERGEAAGTAQVRHDIKRALDL